MTGSKLALGSVQFGMEYGIGSELKTVSKDEFDSILNLALRLGVDTIDTASLYGNSEERLSNSRYLSHFNFISKTINCNNGDVCHDFIDDFKRKALESCEKLSFEAASIEGLIFHRPSDVLKPGGEKLYKTLEELKSLGKVRKIGFSIYSPEELDTLKKHFDFDLIQLPVNIFDQRALSSNAVEELYMKGVEFHSRSTFLKGAIFQELSCLPPELKKFHNNLEYFSRKCLDFQVTPVELAFSFIKSVKFLSKVVVGVQSTEQLKETVGIFESSKPLVSSYKDFASSELDFINPSLWQR